MTEGYSFQTGRIPDFSIPDYVVFLLLLALSAAIGLFYAIRDKIQKKENTTEFLLAGRSMSIFPVAMSLTVTFLSALTLLGNPTEMYNYNTMFLYLTVAMLLAMFGAGVIFIPFFYRLGVTSVFQYLEMRFDYSVRLMGSSILVVQTLIYMSFVLYAPALALSAVTGINLWACMVGIGAVVTFYTSLGGMKAVLWTDTLQFVVMVGGLLAVLIKGIHVVGGFSAALEIADERHRIVFDDFSFDPSTRHSVWSIVVGGGIMWTALFGVNQAQVQRCLSTSSVRKAQLAIAINTPGLIGIIILTCFIGIVMFAFYADCHPLSLGIISNTDQLLPLFVMDILGTTPGVPGLFVSCVFSGSLSSLSSSLNGIATVVFKDFLEPFCCTHVSEFRATIFNKLLVVGCGCISMALAYLVSQLGNVMQATYTIHGLINGPFFGLFVAGMFFPWINKWGTLVGCFVSLMFMSWLGIGGFVHKVSTAVKSEVSTAGCYWNFNATTNNTTDILSNVTTTAASMLNTTTGSTGAKSYDGIERMYTMSYLYYTAAGMVVMVGVALFVSLFTGLTKPKTLDPRLICPLFDTIFPCLPECILRPLRFGIDHHGKYERHDTKLKGDNEVEWRTSEDKIKKVIANGHDNVGYHGDMEVEIQITKI